MYLTLRHMSKAGRNIQVIGYKMDLFRGGLTPEMGRGFFFPTNILYHPVFCTLCMNYAYYFVLEPVFSLQ